MTVDKDRVKTLAYAFFAMAGGKGYTTLEILAAAIGIIGMCRIVNEVPSKFVPAVDVFLRAVTPPGKEVPPFDEVRPEEGS